MCFINMGWTTCIMQGQLLFKLIKYITDGVCLSIKMTYKFNHVCVYLLHVSSFSIRFWVSLTQLYLLFGQRETSSCHVRIFPWVIRSPINWYHFIFDLSVKQNNLRNNAKNASTCMWCADRDINTNRIETMVDFNIYDQRWCYYVQKYWITSKPTCIHTDDAWRNTVL